MQAQTDILLEIAKYSYSVFIPARTAGINTEAQLLRCNSGVDPSAAMD